MTPEALALSKKIKCPVCAGQTIDASDTPMAKDLRAYVQDQLGEGRSSEDILAGLQARYGDEILADPPIISSALWSILPLAGICLILFLKTRQGKGHK